MATIASLTDFNRGIPAQGAAGQNRFIVALGPLKIEFNFFQVATGADFEDNDTFTSRLAHPWAAGVVSVNADLGGTAFAGSVTLDATESSATFKTVTLRDITTATDSICVIVFGF